MARAPVSAIALALAIALASCGTDDVTTQTVTTQPTRLSATERRAVDSYDRTIAQHCVRVSRSLVDPRAGPTPAQEERAFDAVDELLALAAEKPTAPLGAGQDLRLFVSDLAENLEGSNCDPRLIARLEEGLARLPP